MIAGLWMALWLGCTPAGVTESADTAAGPSGPLEEARLWDGHHALYSWTSSGDSDCYAIWHASGETEGWDALVRSTHFELELYLEEHGAGGEAGVGTPCREESRASLELSGAADALEFRFHFLDPAGAELDGCEGAALLDERSGELSYASPEWSPGEGAQHSCSGSGLLLP